MTFTLKSPKVNSSPPFTVRSMPGIFAFSASGPDNADAELFFQRFIAFDMIEMVMGGEDEIERPAAPFQCRFDGIGVGRIDGGCQRAFGIMDQNAVIIAAADELFDFKRLVPSCAWRSSLFRLL